MLLTLVLILLPACVYAWDTVNGSYILTDENLEQVLSEEPLMIVFVYTDWCGHCKATFPIWEEVATSINGNANSKTKVFSADIEVNKKIHNDWDVTSFPTIFYLRGGERKLFSETRSSLNMFKFIEVNEQDPVLQISQADLEDVIASTDLAIVGEFSDAANSKWFKLLAWNLGYSSFYHVEESTKDRITVYSQHEGKPKQRVISDLTEKDKVEELVKKYRRPYVIPFSREAHLLTFEIKDRSLSVLLFHDHAEEGSEERLAQFGMAARAYQNDCTFVEMDMANGYVKMFTNFFGVKTADLPIVYLADTSKQSENLAKTKDITESGVAQLIEDFLAGTAETSAPKKEAEDELPEDWESRSLKYLTSDNFVSYVTTPERAVLVMVHKESCPHCVKMKPIWEDLAEKYKEHPTLKVAELKSSNVAQIKDLTVQKVPTILFYPTQTGSDLSTAVEYEGDRTLKGVEEFIFTQLSKNKDEL